jgi:hypothetical protein
MVATWAFIENRVGEKGAKHGPDVRALQQLLVAAGTTEPNVLGGGWGEHTRKALNAFQDAHTLPIQNFVEPDDDCLFQLADEAEILIPMPNKLGITGVKLLQQWFVDNQIDYEPGAQNGLGTRAFYGLDFKDKMDYAVQRDAGAFRAGPVLMNCTTYVNMMVSVFIHGNVHTTPYDADCSDYGATSNNHIARNRYKMPLLSRTVGSGDKTKNENYFRPDDIDEGTESARLYVIEVAGGSQGGVSHMALLYDGQVYECTTGQSGSACISRTLEQFLENKKKKIFYIFGPQAG